MTLRDHLPRRGRSVCSARTVSTPDASASARAQVIFSIHSRSWCCCHCVHAAHVSSDASGCGSWWLTLSPLGHIIAPVSASVLNIYRSGYSELSTWDADIDANFIATNPIVVGSFLEDRCSSLMAHASRSQASSVQQGWMGPSTEA